MPATVSLVTVTCHSSIDGQALQANKRQYLLMEGITQQDALLFNLLSIVNAFDRYGLIRP